MTDLMFAMPSPLQQALVMACLADGRTRLHQVHLDIPTRLLIENLLALGVAIVVDNEASTIEVAGTGGYWPNSDAELDCRDSFPLSCMLAGACSIGRGQYTVVCTTSNSSGVEAFAPLLRSLLDLGAAISHDLIDGRVTISLGPTALRGGAAELALTTPPSVLASLLMVAPYAMSDVFVNCSPNIALAVSPLLTLMDRFGVSVLQDGPRFIISAPQRYRGLEFNV